MRIKGIRVGIPFIIDAIDKLCIRIAVSESMYNWLCNQLQALASEGVERNENFEKICSDHVFHHDAS